METTFDEISDLRDFINNLNLMRGGIVVVEGKRDSEALKKLGFTEQVLVFHSFGGITKFADSVSHHKSLIILFDSDRKGKYLTRRLIEQLEHRTRIDLSYKKRLIRITKGRIRAIEELIRYEPFVNGLMV